MHAERDYLTRIVFPELRSRCLRLGVEFVGLDLRWGVTEEESRARGALSICLDEIEKCRPFFVCLLGDRYGWIPPPEEIAQGFYDGLRDSGNLPSEVAAWYLLDPTSEPPMYRLRRDESVPELVADGLVGFWEARGLPYAGQSITAREVFRGVVEHGYPATHALFYLRRSGIHRDPQLPRELVPVFTDSGRGPGSKRAKLAELKRQVWRRRSTFVVRRYITKYIGLRIEPTMLPTHLADADRRAVENGVIEPVEWQELSMPVKEVVERHGTVALSGIEELGEQILSDLWAAIQSEVGSHEAKLEDAHARERAYHERFIHQRTQLFLGRRSEVRKVIEYVQDSEDRSPFVVTGEPGCGKSAFLAKCARIIRRLARDRPQRAIVVSHFVGASPGSPDLYATLRSVCEELHRRAGLREEVPHEPEQLRLQLARSLTAAARLRPVVLFLDALNQLDPAHGSHLFDWLPNELPQNARLVVSTLKGAAMDRLKVHTQPDHIIELPGLPFEARERLVRRDLAVRRKRLSREQLAELLDQQKRPDSTRPLYLLIALEELSLFGDYAALSDRISRLPPTLSELFEQVLARLEYDHGSDFTRSLCGWIAASRSGLLESEILALLEEPLLGFPLLRWSRLHRALEFYLRPVDRETGEGLLGFYHDQLRVAVFQRYFGMPGTGGTASETLLAAHRALALYFHRIADPQGDRSWSSAQPRGLGELVYHRLRAGDLTGLSELVRTGFLEKKAQAFGDVEALVDAKLIAELQGQLGDERWDDLIQTASAYCDLAERVTNSEQTFEKLIARGQIDRVRLLIQTEPLNERRGALMLACSVLCAEHQHAAEADELWREGVRLCKPALGSLGWSLEYPARALMEQEVHS